VADHDEVVVVNACMATEYLKGRVRCYETCMAATPWADEETAGSCIDHPVD
jgi:hypothetical protein